MADMPNAFWSGWIAVVTIVSLVFLAWLVLSIYFSSGAQAMEKHDEDNEPVWDGDLSEGHNAPPLWWFWFILATMVFTVVYLMLYPGLGKGALNWSQDSRVTSSYAAFETQFHEQRQRIATSTASELQAHPEYMAAAERLYGRNCAVCHGPDAEGQASLFPNLMDDEWQWGNSAEAIETSIRQGRTAEMMSWQNILNGTSVNRVAD
ncbi:MAG: cbb3-type cytochrome c oxidase N-terminal domain-containing protein [Cellvibrionaceae bacterium]